MPYAYLAWLLPVAVLARLAPGPRGLAAAGGLLLFTVVTSSSSTDPRRSGRCAGRCGWSRSWCWRWWCSWRGVDRFGLRQTVAAPAVAVAGLGRRGRSRVAAPGALDVGAHLCGALVVGAGLALVWWLVRDGQTRAGRARAQPHSRWPAWRCSTASTRRRLRPSATRPPPSRRTARRWPGPWATCSRSAQSDDLMQSEPGFAGGTSCSGPAWYLNPHSVQNTYTAISFDAYKQRYCIYYQGDTCPAAADDAVHPRADHGAEAGRPAGREHPAAGPTGLPRAHAARTRRRAGGSPRRTPNTVLWTRRTPVPGAGGVAWTSPGHHGVAGRRRRRRYVVPGRRPCPPRAGRWC